ncbi:MAG: VCBS repeat-containing protein, partial [Planctomycetota bacterium]
LNGDGDLDIVVATANPFAGFDGLRIFSNDGLGVFTLTESHLLAFPPTGLVIAEVTGDSIPDIVVSVAAFGSLDVFIGDGTGSFTHPTHYLAQNGPRALTAGDFNGDLATDLAVASQNDVVTVHLHK